MNDIIIQFARLWGQNEAYILNARDKEISKKLKEYDSEEMLELLTKWAEEYLQSDIEDTVDFFESKLKEIV